MDVEFDAAKDETNRSKHGVSLEMAARLDWESMITMPDTRRNYGEPRMIGFGTTDKRLHCVDFVHREDRVRVISLRKANQREIRWYEKTKQDH